MRGLKESEGAKGAKGVKGTKEVKGSKGNFRLGFWVPTICDHKKLFDYNL